MTICFHQKKEKEKEIRHRLTGIMSCKDRDEEGRQIHKVAKTVPTLRSPGPLEKKKKLKEVRVCPLSSPTYRLPKPI